jgi:hypothetical protein
VSFTVFKTLEFMSVLVNGWNECECLPAKKAAILVTTSASASASKKSSHFIILGCKGVVRVKVCGRLFKVYMREA